MTPGQFADELRHNHPDLVVIYDHEERDGTEHISILPHRSGHPQVNIRFKERWTEWQGYWAVWTWCCPLGRAIGLPGLDYVLPTSTGKATGVYRLPVGLSIYSERILLRMTRRWFRLHARDREIYPPIPMGLRLATSEEIEASR